MTDEFVPSEIGGFAPAKAKTVAVLAGGKWIDTGVSWGTWSKAATSALRAQPGFVVKTEQELGLNPNPFVHRPDGVETPDP